MRPGMPRRRASTEREPSRRFRDGLGFGQGGTRRGSTLAAVSLSALQLGRAMCARRLLQLLVGVAAACCAAQGGGSTAASVVFSSLTKVQPMLSRSSRAPDHHHPSGLLLPLSAPRPCISLCVLCV